MPKTQRAQHAFIFPFPLSLNLLIELRHVQLLAELKRVLESSRQRELSSLKSESIDERKKVITRMTWQWDVCGHHL